MNKILVEVSVGELLDKISILEIKLHKIKDLEKLKFIKEEHSILNDQLNKNVKSDGKLNNLFSSLKAINAKLRMIEDEKRDTEPLINAKQKTIYKIPIYHQVFNSKYGFINNLSILDLIFNVGPESSNYLKKLKV